MGEALDSKAAPARPMTVMAFDFGERRVGVAVGNTLTRTAQPLRVIRYEAKDRLFDAIQALIVEWAPDLLVVGLPTHPDGQAHAMTAKCQRFANQLKGRFMLAVEMVDERYSSVAVEGGDDALAAGVILEQFFSHI